MKSESEVSQSRPTLSDPIDCSLPGSSIHGIFQAKVLEWGAIAFSDSSLGFSFCPNNRIVLWKKKKKINFYIVHVTRLKEGLSFLLPIPSSKCLNNSYSFKTNKLVADMNMSYSIYMWGRLTYSKLNTSAMFCGAGGGWVLSEGSEDSYGASTKVSSFHHITAVVETPTCYIPTTENCA